MDLIVAVDNNWAIGNKGDLLVSIPEDHKFFRQTTMGNVVVLGRKTLAGFPNGLPLAGRDNIILSTDPNYTVRGGTVVHSKEELFEELKNMRIRKFCNRWRTDLRDAASVLQVCACDEDQL